MVSETESTDISIEERLRAAVDEIDQLRRWKTQATKALARWDAVADLVPIGPNQLGLHKYDIVADEIKRLRSLITAWADAEDEADMIRGIDLFTAYEALRKAVGR